MGHMSPKPDPFSIKSPLWRRSCSVDILNSGDLKDGYLQVSVVSDSQGCHRTCRATGWFESVTLFSFSRCLHKRYWPEIGGSH